jgi:hypothetical protein
MSRRGSTGSTPRDRLRAANPVDARDVGDASSPLARALFERIVHSGPEVRPRRRRHWRPLALVLAPLVLGGAVAAGFRWFRNPDLSAVVRCYPKVSLQARPVVVRASDPGDADACDGAWRDGTLSGRSSNAPALTACVLRGGVTGVFPGSGGADPCDELGLPHVAVTDEGKAIARFQDSVSRHFLSTCTGRDAAMRVVRAQLQKEGLDDWRIAVSGRFTSGTPCASLVVTANARTVLIRPVQRSLSP